jgi:hypothetical protein
MGISDKARILRGSHDEFRREHATMRVASALAARLRRGARSHVVRGFGIFVVVR